MSVIDREKFILRENAPLGKNGWFQTGGPAEKLFKTQDKDHLSRYLAAYPDEPVHIFGVLSNTIIRDGGIKGTVIRLGRDFTKIERIDANTIFAGAMALDKNVARFAADAGIAGLEFFSGIPGTIGGAVKMNAGCYGTETKDVLVEAHGLKRDGTPVTLTPEDLNMRYRKTDLPQDVIVTGAIFRGQTGEPSRIHAAIDEFKQRREGSQPIREKTGGSTFANPEGHKAWQLIDSVGGRGLKIGGAMMSEKHCNFMINTGYASAADLENLGEEIRRRVLDTHGIALRWEIRRLGDTE